MKKIQLEFKENRLMIDHSSANMVMDSKIEMVEKAQEAEESDVVYASNCIPRYNSRQAEPMLEKIHRWGPADYPVECWINALNILFYRLIGNVHFTYAVYMPENPQSSSCMHFNMLIDPNITETTIKEFIYNPVKLYKNSSQTNPELGVTFLTGVKAEEIELKYSSDCPDIMLLFLMQSGAAELKIYYKNQYVESSIECILDGIHTVFKYKEMETDVSNRSFPLDDPSINRLNHSDMDKTVIQYMEENAVQNPNGIALEDEYSFITNAELVKRVNQICHFFDDLTCDSTYIAVMGKRSLEQIIVLLAIIKSGRAYVPLDDSIPAAKLTDITERLHIAVILTDTASEKINQPIVCLQYREIHKQSAAYQDVYENKNTSLTDTICVLQTSGTSGTAKIVEHNQIPIMNVVAAHHKACHFTADDSIAQRSPLQHIPSLSEYFLGIVYDLKTVLISDEILIDAEKFNQYLNEKQITWIQIVPTLMEYYFVNSGFSFDSLKYAVPLGEELKADLLYAFMEKYPHIKVINNYGMTECNTILLADDLQRKKYDKVPLGHAIDNYLVTIVNDAKQVVPKGIIGQIATCYYFKERNTIETNLKHMELTWISDVNEKMLLTGDYGNYLSGTELVEYRNRKDSLCKIKGKRVELLEVEQAVYLFEEVKECKVITDTVDGRNQIIAFIVFKHEKPELLKLRKFLANTIESYMIPEKMIVIDKLPKTKTGKINIAELRKMLQQDSFNGKHTVTELFEKVLNCQPEDDTSFHEMGISSFQMIELADRISELYGIDFSVTELYQYSTIRMLGEYLKHTQKSVKEKNSSKQEAEEKIAVIGISGTFAGNRDAEAFWEAVAEGKCLVEEFPSARKKEIGMQTDSSVISGGYLDEFDEFDPVFFGIAPREAKWMCEEQKQALLYTWKLLEDAGKTKSEMEDKEIAVFIGVADHYKDQHQGEPSNTQYYKMGNDTAMISAKVSYFFNWHGESVTINTACSSSLVAVHEACKSILYEDNEYAVAGGINLITSKQFFEDTSALGMFSDTGECLPFDDTASGIVPGEAVGFVLLKPYSKAVRDRDQIYAIIEGSLCNQDGKSNGITAPNGRAQSALLRKNLYRANINAREIRYLESHGTATKLGDPIEFNAMSEVLRSDDRVPYCSLGSVKANTGHTIGAAGIVSVIKACLSLKYGILSPQIKFQKPNRLLHMEESPFYIAKEAEPIDCKKKNIVAVNSFGYSGTNANVLLANAPQRELSEEENAGTYYIPLSAKTKRSFEANAAALLNYIKKNKERLQLQDISYTLQKGRTHFKEFRKLLVVKDIDQLMLVLETYKKSGFKEKNGGFYETLSDQDRFLMEQYESGKDIVWADFIEPAGTVISLPTYVFGPLKIKKEMVHRVSIKDTEERVSNHIIEDNKVLPAAAIIEEVRTYASYLLDSAHIRLENIYFIHPIVVNGSVEIVLLFKEKGPNLTFEVQNKGVLAATGRALPIEAFGSTQSLEMDHIDERENSRGMYDFYRSQHILFGTPYRICETLHFGKKNGTDYALARLISKNPENNSCYLLDSAMHSMAYMLCPNNKQAIVPYYLSQMELLPEIDEQKEIYALGYAKNNSINIHLFDEEKNYLGKIQGFQLATAKKTVGFYTPLWKPVNNPVDLPNSEVTFDLLISDENYEFTAIKITKHENTTGIEWKEKTEALSVLVMLDKKYNSYFDAFERVLDFIKSISRVKAKKIKMMFVYFSGNGISNMLNESLESFMRVVKNEMPKITYKILEVPSMDKEKLEEAIGTEALSGFANNLIKYNDHWSRSENVLTKLDELNSSSLRMNNGDTYLIIGGNGHIGRTLIEFFISKYKANIIFTGRRRLDEDTDRFMKDMSKYGIEITYVQMDITDYKSSLSQIAPYKDRIDGVINCAGITSDAFIMNKDFLQARDVLEVKVLGSINSYRLFKDSKIKFLILFSSVSAEMGLIGQCDYAYANRFVNRLASSTPAGFHIASIGWGYWKDGGMKMPDYMLEKYLKEGKYPIENNTGCRVLEQVINSDYANVFVY
ncbi:SDR family NAD(P)-dependent oxidoreductase [Clostridium aminobutyricum]|uniref:SDR family NAD(P)-dependent oxidoreductase n=1 Tax=Clostridium aminobutyricum TaxID=33953 RepID=A0A939DAZ3_CLOAM|nr:SDR family NAD(P)-dependent oxidoreductase [Clostridium aminobutyricum]MBN7773943.1 SDR family NAD(P)-dependent oxidoreductase [Clostridium aminobutyricum]